LNAILRGLTQNEAETHPLAPDRRLRGRTYAIPFDVVWTAALALADGGIRGWTVARADDEAGVIEAISRTLVFHFEDDVRVTVRLDENGQSRVDLQSASRVGGGDLGRNPRTIGGFLRKLDRSLHATPNQILDPTGLTAWHGAP